MVLGIHLNAMRQDVVFADHIVTANMSEWMGRGVAIVKSGIETVLSCLQDKRIAVISLIAVNLLMCEAVVLSSKCLAQSSYCDAFKIKFQNGSSFWEIDMAGCAIFCAAVAGVVGFAKYTKLPLSSLAIFGISVGTLIVRIGFDCLN